MNYETWDTGKGDHIEKPYDHYEEVAPMALGIQDMSAKEQIICRLIISDADDSFLYYSGQYCERLRQQYASAPRSVSDRKLPIIPTNVHLPAYHRS